MRRASRLGGFRSTPEALLRGRPRKTPKRLSVAKLPSATPRARRRRKGGRPVEPPWASAKRRGSSRTRTPSRRSTLLPLHPRPRAEAPRANRKNRHPQTRRESRAAVKDGRRARCPPSGNRRPGFASATSRTLRFPGLAIHGPPQRRFPPSELDARRRRRRSRRDSGLGRRSKL